MDFLGFIQLLDSALRLSTPLLLACLAGLFSADHKFSRNKKCVLNLPEIGKKHVIVCANHKKKKELSFCEGDIVMFKYSSSPQHIFTIKNEMIFADDTLANRGTRTHYDKIIKVVKRFSCNDRKAYLNKRKTSVIRANFNPNYWPRN